MFAPKDRAEHARTIEPRLRESESHAAFAQMLWGGLQRHLRAGREVLVFHGIPG